MRQSLLLFNQNLLILFTTVYLINLLLPIRGHAAWVFLLLRELKSRCMLEANLLLL